MICRSLALLNRLKVEARRDWLTDSQSAATAEIERHWHFPERVNLCGAPGTGKTFLAWSLARASGAIFYPSPRIYHHTGKPGAACVVVDNAPDNAGAMRQLLAAFQLHDARTALLITTQPNRLGLPTVTLPTPTSQDVDMVYHNLSRLDYYALRPVYVVNLWDVISSVLQ